MTIVVVGSGPAGVFAALGALQAGARVLMLDAGLQLEPEAQALKETLGAKDWKKWTTNEYAALKASGLKATDNLSAKRVFGSDFATRSLSNAVIREKNCCIIQSNALGGLSNIWGRGIEPPYIHEYDHWPDKEDFIQSLKTVLSHIPFSADNDNLAQVMPLYSTHFILHSITHVSEGLLAQWNTHAEALNNSGVHFGRTRLALRADKHNKYGCQLCGMCFYGCVYGALFDTSEMVAHLRAHYPNFDYRPGVVVKSFISHADSHVEIVAEGVHNRKIEPIKASKLILAAGAAQTTLIVMRSVGAKQAILKNSDLIRMAFLKISGGTIKDNEDYHTLSQLTVTVDNRTITKKAIVIHLFGKNPMIEDAALSLFPRWLRSMLSKLLAPVLKRLYVGMCFLHSDDSASIQVEDHGAYAEFSSKRKCSVFIIYWRLLGFLLRHIKKTKLLPIPGISKVTLPGSSVHIGASLSSNNTSDLATNKAGQLVSSPLVYVADAASLPDIPAGSYTLSIMANAHRIGSITGKLTRSEHP